MKRVFALGLVAALALPVLGCGDDESIVKQDDPPQVEPYPPATTPDQLVTNLAQSYNDRHYEEYDKLMAPGFLFYLSQEDVNAGADRSFSRARDLEATYHMFQGEPGIERSDGTRQPPIRKITLRLTPDAAPWTDQVGEDFLGTLMKRYEVDMTVEYVEDRPSSVIGLQEFYVEGVERDDGHGGTTTVYQLKYWRDLGKEGFKAVEQSSWGSLKNLY